MLINAFIVALSHLHVRWENKRYERSRWMIVAALIGLAIQYVLQMTFGFRAMHDNLGAVINILLYTPCFSLISIGIYNIETTRANLRKMILMCSGIYAAIIAPCSREWRDVGRRFVKLAVAMLKWPFITTFYFCGII